MARVEVDDVGEGQRLPFHEVDDDRGEQVPGVVTKVVPSEGLADDPARVAASATPWVWLACEMHTSRRGGSMLLWVAKPTRQPEVSPFAAAVTT